MNVDAIWRRLSRSVPVLGLLGHWAWAEDRLDAADNNDAIYSLVAADEAHIEAHGKNSRLKERAIITGEVVSHVTVLLVAAAIWWLSGELPLFGYVWLAAFAMDLLGGRAGLAIFQTGNRKAIAS